MRWALTPSTYEHDSAPSDVKVWPAEVIRPQRPDVQQQVSEGRRPPDHHHAEETRVHDHPKSGSNPGIGPRARGRVTECDKLEDRWRDHRKNFIGTPLPDEAGAVDFDD
jgi:hypothetical protein